MNDKKTKHTLNIQQTLEHDFGVYTCKAINNLGEASKNITLEGTPSRPKFHQGEVDDKNDSTFILTWHLESFSPIKEYKLEYRQKGADAWKVTLPRVTDGKGTSFTVHHPIEGMERGPYEAILSARNDYGWSPKSYPFTFNGEYRQSVIDDDKSSASEHRTTILTVMLLVLSSFVYSSL